MNQAVAAAIAATLLCAAVFMPGSASSEVPAEVRGPLLLLPPRRPWQCVQLCLLAPPLTCLEAQPPSSSQLDCPHSLASIMPCPPSSPTPTHACRRPWGLPAACSSPSAPAEATRVLPCRSPTPCGSTLAPNFLSTCRRTRRRPPRCVMQCTSGHAAWRCRRGGGGLLLLPVGGLLLAGSLAHPLCRPPPCPLTHRLLWRRRCCLFRWLLRRW